MVYLLKILVLLAMTTYAQAIAAQIAVPELELRDGKYYIVGGKSPYTGVYIEYFDKERKRKFKQVDYKNGLVDGKLILWKKNETLDVEIKYKSGLMQYKQYSKNKLTISGDCIKDLCNFKTHKKNGSYAIAEIDEVVVNPLLSKRSDIIQVIGEMHETRFYANGNKNSEKIKYYRIVNGKQIEEKRGTWTFWYENGQIKRQGNYRNGKKEGVWTRWDENGKVVSVRNYVKGELYERKIHYIA